MTALQYGPPPATTRVTVGKVLTVLASLAGPPAAAFVGFWGFVEYTGCFLGCNDTGNPSLGVVLLALALVLLLAAPVLAATLVRRWTWVLGAVAAPFLEAAWFLGPTLR